MHTFTTPEKSRSQYPLYHKRIFFTYLRGMEGNTTNPTKFLPLHFVKDDEPSWQLIQVHSSLHLSVLTPPILLKASLLDLNPPSKFRDHVSNQK